MPQQCVDEDGKHVEKEAMEQSELFRNEMSGYGIHKFIRLRSMGAQQSKKYGVDELAVCKAQLEVCIETLVTCLVEEDTLMGR